MNTYLFVAYSVVWAVIFLYLLYLNKRQRQLGEELKALSESTPSRHFDSPELRSDPAQAIDSAES